ncbi:MAG: hypothetical protein ACTSYS_16275 [Promethearchaeota archaeon]
MKDALLQVYNVWIFELYRQRKKIIIGAIITMIVIIMDTVLPYSMLGQPLPDTATDFAKEVLSFIRFLLIFMVATHAGTIIAGEFEKRTGIVLFPKTGKTRVFIGKTFAAFTGIVIFVSIYYLTGALVILGYFSSIPVEYFWSFGFACLFAGALIGVQIFYSTIMKTGTVSIILFIITYIIIFNMITSIFTLALPDLEPLAILSYSDGLMSNILNMPDPRYIDIPVTEDFTVRQWLTPTIQVGVLISIIYTCVSLFMAYLIFRKREV